MNMRNNRHLIGSPRNKGLGTKPRTVEVSLLVYTAGTGIVLISLWWILHMVVVACKVVWKFLAEMIFI